MNPPPYEITTEGIDSNYLGERAEENLLLGLTPTLTNDAGQAGGFSGGNQWNLVDAQIYIETHTDYLSPDGDNVPMRFTYDLLQSVPIDQFLIVHYWFRGGVDFTTQEYELYVSDSLADLYTDENKVLYYDNRGKYNATVLYSGTQQMFTFTDNKPVGRYVGLRVINMSASDKRGRLDQLAVYSAGVKPVDAAVALSFEDEASGVKVSVLRNNSTDLFNLADSLRVRSVSLSPEAQTMADDFHLDLLGDAIVIELLDKSGRVLSDADLGGRVVKIEIPMPDENSGASTMLCRIIDGELHQLSISFLDDKYATTYIRGSLGTFALFKDTLSLGAGLPGAADIGGAAGNLDNGNENTPPRTGVLVPWLLAALPPIALAVLMVTFKKRRGGCR